MAAFKQENARQCSNHFAAFNPASIVDPVLKPYIIARLTLKKAIIS
jgi:hypothetical protein